MKKPFNVSPKRILITGDNSYIGTNLEAWLTKDPENYQVTTICVKDDSWREVDFSLYDTVVHVAGLVHVRETKRNRDLYYTVNRDLTYEVALKAKRQGIKYFLFMSSISVFGLKNGIIDKKTVPKPRNHYGKSKFEAESLITSLEDDSFRIGIIRPPMVYGPNCKGNYPRLSRLAKKVPVFPEIDNRRSVIYIDNLSEHIKILLDNKMSGIFHPHNGDYVSTYMLVREIAYVHGKKVHFTKIANWIIVFAAGIFDVLNKAFGNLAYDPSVAVISDAVSFQESIGYTELGDGVNDR